MSLPSPGSEAFNQLGPEARKLARWRDESVPLRDSGEKSEKSLRDFVDEAR